MGIMSIGRIKIWMKVNLLGIILGTVFFLIIAFFVGLLVYAVYDSNRITNLKDDYCKENGYIGYATSNSDMSTTLELNDFVPCYKVQNKTLAIEYLKWSEGN